MRVFNTFYYSFSPTVAQSISASEVLRVAFRVLLYPLVASLHMSSALQEILVFGPEFAAVLSGVAAAGFIGASYGVAVGIAGIVVSKRLHKRAHMQQSLMH
jgi:hypothetical protein